MCIVTRTVKDEADMIRFVRGPDGVVVPDLARKLPGRGVWVSLDRKVLEDHIVHDHSHIAAAIIAGNAKKAYLTMHEHTERLVEHFRAYWPKRVGEKIEWR